MESGTLRCVIKRCVIDVQGEEISVYCIKGKGEAGTRKKGAQTWLYDAWQCIAFLFYPPYQRLHGSKARVLSSVGLSVATALPSFHIPEPGVKQEFSPPWGSLCQQPGPRSTFQNKELSFSCLPALAFRWPTLLHPLPLPCFSTELLVTRSLKANHRERLTKVY